MPTPNVAADLNPIDRLLGRIIYSKFFANSMIALILINAFTLGFSTYHPLMAHLQAVYGWPVAAMIDHFEQGVLAIFVFELVAKIRLEGKAFFRSNWNVFDTTVVALSLVSHSPLFAVLRVLRVLRVMRVLGQIRSLRMISAVIVQSIAGCLSITLLMLIVLFLFALASNALFGHTHPALFGDLHTAMYTMFRVAALAALEDVASALVKDYPWVYFFLLPYFVLMSYVVLNFFAAIVVYFLYELSFDELKSGRVVAKANGAPLIPETGYTALAADQYQTLLIEIASLRGEIQSLKISAPVDRDFVATR